MNSNNLEKQKEIILNLFKKKQYDDVIIQGEILLKERQNDAQLIFILGMSSVFPVILKVPLSILVSDLP